MLALGPSPARESARLWRRSLIGQPQRWSLPGSASFTGGAGHVQLTRTWGLMDISPSLIGLPRHPVPPAAKSEWVQDKSTSNLPRQDAGPVKSDVIDIGHAQQT